MDAEAALDFVKNGATLLLLDVPQHTLVGIDTRMFSVGPIFKGIKMIPPGPHFVYYSSSNREGSEFSPIIGFFVDARPSQVIVRKWDQDEERLVKLSEDEENRNDISPVTTMKTQAKPVITYARRKKVNSGGGLTLQRYCDSSEVSKVAAIIADDTIQATNGGESCRDSFPLQTRKSQEEDSHTGRETSIDLADSGLKTVGPMQAHLMTTDYHEESIRPNPPKDTGKHHYHPFTSYSIIGLNTDKQPNLHRKETTRWGSI